MIPAPPATPLHTPIWPIPCDFLFKWLPETHRWAWEHLPEAGGVWEWGSHCLGLTHLGSLQYGAETEVVAAAGFGEGNLDAAPGKRGSSWAPAPAFESPCH